jgi:hypothetical protein
MLQRYSLLSRLGEEVCQIEWLRDHIQFAVCGTRPSLLRFVPVELNAVSIGIGEVERLADPMVRGPLKWDSGAGESLEGVGQIPSSRVEDCDVVEACTGRGRRAAVFALPGVESDMVVIAAGGKEYRVLSISLGYLKTENALIESQRALEVSHLKVDVSDAGAGSDGRVRIC